MIFAGILAGGTGSRMETATMPKQFLDICGKPIFIRTIETFLSITQIDKIICSINVEWKEKYIELIDKYNLDKNKIILTPGGNSRFVSLINIVKKANEIDNKDDSFIITHDCARIFISKDIIKNNIESIKNYEIVTTSIPVIDTIVSSDNGEYINFVPTRSKLWSDQGPQTFYINKFLKYVSMIPEKDYSKYIEAGKVYLSHECKVGIVLGNRNNFKITNDIDLQYAKFLIEGGFIK